MKYTVIIESAKGKRRTLRGVDTWRLIALLEDTLSGYKRIISAIQE